MRSLIVTTVVGVFAVSSWVSAQAPTSTDASSPAAEKFAYVDIQRVASESKEGEVANARVEELSRQKVAEIEAVNAQAQGELERLTQELQESQQNLQQGQNVISQDAAATIQRQIGRLQLDMERTTQDNQAEIQRMTQDAEVEVQELQQQLQLEFEGRLIPAINQLASQKGLSFVFNAQQGLIWADPAMDITEELLVLLNSPASTTP